jgi:hypothetical protein
VSPEAQKLAQALLDHHRKVCRTRSGETSSTDSCLITYGAICDRVGLPHIKPKMGKYLREVAQWCRGNNWPPLNALAVNHDTRKPGHGYDGAPGCSLERWQDEVTACINFAYYPDVFT